MYVLNAFLSPDTSNGGKSRRKGHVFDFFPLKYINILEGGQFPEGYDEAPTYCDIVCQDKATKQIIILELQRYLDSFFQRKDGGLCIPSSHSRRNI
jgi:hypothetical protein